MSQGNLAATVATLAGKLDEIRKGIAKTPFPVYHIPTFLGDVVFGHSLLSGVLDFWPYDEETDAMIPTGFPTFGTEIFVGGLWPGVTASVVPWLCHRFGMQVSFHDASEHVDYCRGHGARFRGCAHVRVDCADVDSIIENVHERVLFDFYGVWIAHSEQQKDALTLYCSYLRKGISVRPLSSHAMTCQRASRRFNFRQEFGPIRVPMSGTPTGGSPPSYYTMTRQELAALYLQLQAAESNRQQGEVISPQQHHFMQRGARGRGGSGGGGHRGPSQRRRFQQTFDFHPHHQETEFYTPELYYQHQLPFPDTESSYSNSAYPTPNETPIPPEYMTHPCNSQFPPISDGFPPLEAAGGPGPWMLTEPPVWSTSPWQIDPIEASWPNRHTEG
jgi:hypothetical protein